MANISYGVVQFGFVDTGEISRKQILDDGGNYLYTRWIVDFECLWSPNVTSYTAINGGTPIQQNGILATPTDVSIRTYLAQPRRTLIVSYGNDIIIETPSPAYQTPQGTTRYQSDACNGPLVEDVTVAEVHGFRTFRIHMRIVAHVLECNSHKPLLSNTWTRSVSINHGNFAEVVTRGKAVFRRDELIRRNAWPDLYRKDFLIGIPPHFRREKIDVSPDADGNTIFYEVVDVEVPFGLFGQYTDNNTVATDAIPTRYELFYSTGYEQIGQLEANMNVLAQTAGGLVRGIANPLNGAQEIGRGAVAWFSAGTSQVPLYVMNVILRAWGASPQNRRAMIMWGLAIIFSKFPLVRNQAGLPGLRPDRTKTNKLEITEGIGSEGEKYVEINMTQRWPGNVIDAGLVNLPGAGNINQAANWIGILSPALPWVVAMVNAAAARFNANFPNGNAPVVAGVPAQEEDALKNVLACFSTTDDLVGSFTPPAGRPISAAVGYNVPIVTLYNNGRGNFLCQLIAQSLSTPCSLPPQPSTSAELVNGGFQPGQQAVQNQYDSGQSSLYKEFPED